MIDDLMMLATTLASGPSGTGRPKSVDLRRVVSTAYYASFHTLANLCAVELVGVTKPWAVFTPVYRSVEHHRCRQVLDQKRKADPASVIASVAPIFMQLQDARHEADYDPEPFRLNRNAAIDLIDTAGQAIGRLCTLPSGQKLELAVSLVAAPKRNAQF